MKCDRAKPHCGSCVTNETVDLCSYSQQPWEYLSTEKQLSNEVLRLKLRINELERALHQQQMVSPPDSLSTLFSSGNEQDDPLIDLGVRFDKLVIKQNRLVHYGTTSFLGLQANDPVLLAMYRKFFQKHHQDYLNTLKKGPQSLPKTLDDIVKKEKDDALDPICWSEKPATLVPLSSTVNPNDKIEDFINPINKLLPSLEITWLLVDYFFDAAYSMVPYIDENVFRASMSSILFTGPNGETVIKCTQPSELALVSLFLIVMRMSYLVLPFKDYYINQDRIEDMRALKLCASGIDISPIYVEHAKNCIMNTPGPDNIMKKITLLNIQVLLLLKLYKFMCPEDGDEGSDSTILLAMVLQMARTQGLYRDPDRFQDVVGDENTRFLWRKIWYKLLLLDAYQAIIAGSPLIVNDDQWDCALPSLSYSDKAYVDTFISKSSRKNNPLYDAAKFNRLYRDYLIVQSMEIEFKTTLIIREVVQLSHNMKVTPRKSDFVKMLKRVEDCGSLVLESFHELIYDEQNTDHEHQVLNLKKFEAKCKLYLVRYILSYIILLSSDDEEDINNNFNNLYGEDSEYLVKCTETSLQLFKIAYDFMIYETENEISCTNMKFYQLAKRFYGSFDKVMGSFILVGAQRSLQFLNSIILRYGINFFSFTSLIRSFDNTKDAVEVLQWFNISIHDLSTNVDVSLDKQFNIMLYQYTKIFYTKCYALQDKLFHCLRLGSLFKLFINYLKMTFPAAYEELNGNYVYNKVNDELTGNDANADIMQQFISQQELDELMNDVLFRNEEELLNSILVDQRLVNHTIFDELSNSVYPRPEEGDRPAPGMLAGGVPDNMLGFGYIFSGDIMSPIPQINEIFK